MKKTIFEEMGGTYIRHGDYLIPCLILPDGEENKVIGVWGCASASGAHGANRPSRQARKGICVISKSISDLCILTC